ncbi:hypothetical protein HN011_003365 [Eciton burchellii]|nr:hypothetical protein HN011_003365 [Eciton burchellii]
MSRNIAAWSILFTKKRIHRELVEHEEPVADREAAQRPSSLVPLVGRREQGQAGRQVAGKERGWSRRWKEPSLDLRAGSPHGHWPITGAYAGGEAPIVDPTTGFGAVLRFDSGF